MEIPAALKSILLKYRKAILVTVSTLGVLLVLGMVHLSYAPVNKLKEWRAEASALESPEFVRGMDSLQRQIAYKQALLGLPKKDSINLVLNVPDSTLGLFINGLSIYRVKLTEMDLDPLLKRLDEEEYWSQFSKPLLADTSRASIVKEPIIEKTAPKTQEEFLASVSQPDSVVYEPVFIQMTLENGVELFIGQNDEKGRSDSKVKRQFYAPKRWGNIKSLLASVFTFKALEYHPEITLEASGAELTSIYRALPQQPKVVIFYY